MALDIAALVSPLSDEAPSGPDLSYDNERIEIESAFERSVSVDNVDDDTTDWRSVIAQITAQAERTRDMWLPVYLMRAAAASKRFDLVVEGAQLLAGLVEERWGDVHPQLDEYGFIGRKTPCESLTRTAEFTGPLSRVPLIEHPRLGRFTGEDLIRFRDQGASAPNYGMFRKVIDDMPAEDLQAVLGTFDSLITAVRRLDGVMTANAEGDTATNFRPTYDVLDSIRAALASHVPGVEAEPSADMVSAEGWPGDPGAADMGSSGAAGPVGPGFSGTIRSRDEAIRALDAVCAYFASFEPGSPVPLALTRAREWIGLDFMSVLQDIAPNSLGEAGTILRSRISGAGDASNSSESDWSAAPAPVVADSGW
jgi:type VI secretion system protein ImpA